MSDLELYVSPPTVETPEDCYFYHVMEIPGHGMVGGDWDLRGREAEYLGSVRLDGQRVLEIGPASGFLTFYMEGRGAEVVAVDLPTGSEWDMVPHFGVGSRDVAAWLTVMRQLKNGFWLAHRRHRSAAKVHYGNVYALPDEMGRFDVAVMAAVLLHVRDPLGVVEQCAKRSDRIVITDIHVPELDGHPVQQLVPTRDSPQWDTWWCFAPDLFVQFLEVLGFATEAVTFHVQAHVSEGVMYPMPMMTIVAHRLSR